MRTRHAPGRPGLVMAGIDLTRPATWHGRDWPGAKENTCEWPRAEHGLAAIRSRTAPHWPRATLMGKTYLGRITTNPI